MWEEWVVDVDPAKFFVPVFMSIALAKVSTSAAEARSRGFLGPKDRIVFNRDFLIGEAKKEVLKMVDEGYAPPIKQPIKVLGQAAQGMIEVEIFNMLRGKYITEIPATKSTSNKTLAIVDDISDAASGLNFFIG